MDLDRISVANTRSARLRGLAWRRRSRAGPGLLIPHCRSVHTFGMWFRLDVYFLDAGGEVVREVRRIGPCRFVACRVAESVLEIPSR
jgi:uncharacterized membrane protein (UPF0127 family)